MESLNDDVLLHIFSLYSEKINLLRLVCKKWKILLPYKIMKIISSSNDKNRSIKYNFNYNCIKVNLIETTIFEVDGIADLDNFFMSLYKGKVVPTMVYEESFVPSVITDSITNCCKYKMVIRSNFTYKLLVYDPSAKSKTFDLYIPFITHGNHVFDFKYFMIEVRDILPNEFGPIKVSYDVKMKKNYEEYYYKICRDLPVKYLDNMIKYTIADSNYKVLYDRYFPNGKFVDKPILPNKKSENYINCCPCCGKIDKIKDY